MKTKDITLWEDKRQLEEFIKNKPILSLKTNLVIKTVYVDYLIECHETRKNLLIIRYVNKKERRILERSGYKIFQTEEIHIPTIKFLVEYVFRS